MVYEFAMQSLLDDIIKTRLLRRCLERSYAFKNIPFEWPVVYVRSRSLFAITLERRGFRGAPLLGPLALIHASSIVRAECVSPMLILVNEHYRAAKAKKDIWERVWESYSRKETTNCDMKELRVALRDEWKIAKVKSALEGAAQ